MRLAWAIALCGCAAGSTSAQRPAQLDDGIRVGSLDGFDGAKIAAVTARIADGTYPDVHSLLIFKHGKLVYENYFAGADRHRGSGALGIVKHDRETLHDMRSVSKSVVAMAVLHAVTTGQLESLDEPIFKIFPEHESLEQGITIRHLLSMSAGFEWNEAVPYEDPRNSEHHLEDAADPISYVLGQKLVATPGSTFNYNGGSTEVLAEIVRRKTGLVIDQYVAKHLFAPLGISRYEWIRNSNGAPSAASGLRLRSRDIAKIGLLVWQEGTWQGKQLIRAALIRDALSKQMTIADPPEARFSSLGYGYQIWIAGYRVGDVTLEVPCFSGNGGQTVCIDRSHDVMTVTTAGYYNRDVKNPAWALYPDLIFPALTD